MRLPMQRSYQRRQPASPVKRDARYSVEAIETLAKLALAEPARELAVAGFATVSERIALKHLADTAGMRPDAPFIPQLDSPPSNGGVPLGVFPEPFDPDHDQQRKDVERLRIGGWEDPADTAARNEASRSPDPNDDNDGSDDDSDGSQD